MTATQTLTLGLSADGVTEACAVATDPGAAGSLSRDERSTHTRVLLAAAAEQPDRRAELLDAVIVLNCRVADAVATRFRHHGTPLDDLRQAAYEGLVKAVHRFDPQAADDLLTYAVPIMRGEVQRHLRDRTWLIRPPRHVQETDADVRAAEAHLTQGFGRAPRVDEICAYLGLDEADYRDTLLAMRQLRCDSLDRPLGDALDSATLVDVLDAAGDDRELLRVETRALLRVAMRTLSDRERRAVYLRYFEELTQAQIGERLGIGQTQTARLLERAVHKLRLAVESVPRDRRPASRT